MRNFFCFGALALVLSGCGKETPSHQFTQAELEQLAAKRLQAVADDKSLSDLAAIQKYIDALPLTPRMFVPGTTKLATAKPDGDGYTIEVVKYDWGYMGRTNKDQDMVKLERQSLKESADFCAKALQGLAGRKLTSVRVRLYASLQGKEIETFSAVATSAHLAALQSAGAPEPGSNLDPRAPGIAKLWKVEKNVYPELVYRKIS